MADDDQITLSLPKSLGEEKEKIVELLRLLIEPDLSKHEKFKQYLTKDLKTGNFTSHEQMHTAVELTDLSFQTRRMGAEDFADFMLLMRETNGAVTDSFEGFMARIARSEIKIEDIKIADKKKESILNRKGNQ